MSFPRMSWHIGDYKKDTGHLRAAEHGAYFLLTMHYWTTGGLPNDDKRLAIIACMTDREWKAARPTIAAFFKEGWKHKRIDEELAAACNRSASASASASHRWASRNANASETHNEGNAIEPHTVRNANPCPRATKPKKVSTLSARATPLPENWFPSEGDLSFARSKSWPESKIASEAQRFCDHARAKNRRQVDWAAAWRNWVTSPFQLQNSKGNDRGNEISRGSAGGDRARELAQLAREREAEAGIGGPPDDIASPRDRWEID